MIRTPRPHLGVAACSHPGLSGKSNEDRFAVASFTNSTGRPVVLAVVADGIGGHLAGEVAAELTVETVVREVAGSDGRHPVEIMRTAIQSASEAIAERSASHDDQKGMGSTCACVWIEGNRLYTAYVGDSRIYLIRNGQINLTSVDHTWIQEAIEKGFITLEQAQDHPNAHVLRRHLGSPALPKVDSRLRLHGANGDSEDGQNQGLELGPNETVLLCSDGLTDMVRDDEILRLVAGSSPLRSIADSLVERANSAGGRDNITVVLIGTARPLLRVRRFTGVLSRVLRL